MAVRAGNQCYSDIADVPAIVPVFPLSGALLLPGGQLPLNIFEPRYVAMVDHALAGDRLIGMIQPKMARAACPAAPDMCGIGCLGRVVQVTETGDGRYLISLIGVCRFAPLAELDDDIPFRRFRISVEAFAGDLEPKTGEHEVDRTALLAAFRRYLDANGMDADWDSVGAASNAGLVTALSMMSPWGPAEKQALLEAPDLKTRAETLVAITELALAGESRGALQ